MLPLTKTVEESDYQYLIAEVKLLERTRDKLIAGGAKLDDWNVSHTHRKWEWGMAIKSLSEWYEKFPGRWHDNNVYIIDVGAGDGVLGPTLAAKGERKILEIEPRSECKVNRDKVNEILLTDILVATESLESWTGYSADVVFCISVIEHVAEDSYFLDTLANTVKPGGLLFLTTDVVPDKSKAYTFDNLRAHNYDVGDVAEMMNDLMRSGLTPFGGVDLEFKSVQVYDYSFCSLCMLKQ